MPADPNFVELNDNTTAGAKVAVFQYTDSEANVVQVQAIAVLHPDGVKVERPTPLPVTTTVEEKALYEVASATVSYKGFAPRGTAPAAASWRIRKFVVDVLGNPVSETWATDVAWDDRASATYT